MSETTELMQVVKQTAFNVAGISEQMGIISTEVQNLKIEVRRQAENIAAVNNRMQNYEDRIRLTRPQAQTVKSAIHSRAKELLDIRYEDGIVAEECLFADKYFRPGFISRLYTDARRDSKLGTPYYETYQRDYAEVLDYIAGWQPPTGVEGYKKYLLDRKNK